MKLAQFEKFRREHFTVFEENIIAAWKNKETIDNQVLDYWKIWTSNIPQLQEVKELKIYYHRTPVQPEKRTEFIVNELIYEGSPFQMK